MVALETKHKQKGNALRITKHKLKGNMLQIIKHKQKQKHKHKGNMLQITKHKQKDKHNQKGNELQITKCSNQKSIYKDKMLQIDYPKPDVLQEARGSDELDLQKQQQKHFKKKIFGKFTSVNHGSGSLLISPSLEN